MEAGLAGGPGKFQSRQLHSTSSKLPLSFGSLLRDSVFWAAWQIGSCEVAAFSMWPQPAAPTCSPLLKGSGGVEVGRWEQLCRQSGKAPGPAGAG